jgi:hypothetical protein
MILEHVNPANTWTSLETPPYTVGDIYWNQTSLGDKGFVFIKDDGAGVTGDGYVVLLDGSTLNGIMASTTTSAPGTGQGKLAGVARAAIAAAGYGWAQIYGPGLVRVTALAAAYTTLNTTATAGQLDDDATAGSEVIEGIILDAARAGTDGTAAGFINWPRVSRML